MPGGKAHLRAEWARARPTGSRVLHRGRHGRRRRTARRRRRDDRRRPDEVAQVLKVRPPFAVHRERLYGCIVSVSSDICYASMKGNHLLTGLASHGGRLLLSHLDDPLRRALHPAESSRSRPTSPTSPGVSTGRTPQHADDDRAAVQRSRTRGQPDRRSLHVEPTSSRCSSSSPRRAPPRASLPKS